MGPYCPACAETIPQGAAECPRCGLRIVAGSDAPLGTLNDLVLVADDTALIREMVKDGLVSEGLAKTVYTASDGQDFIELYMDQLFHDRPVDLVVLDLEMPVLGGAPAAVAMRGMERGCGAKAATIIFFTAHPLNDQLRVLMQRCKPAHYLNKGADASAPRIIKRLREIMRALRM